MNNSDWKDIQDGKLTFVKTDGENEAFVMLCGKLDDYLGKLVGKEKQQSKYDQYNHRDMIHDVIIVLKNNEPVGCGAYKKYDEESVELKRIFVDESVRRLGLGKEIVHRLEEDARKSGFQYAVLETGRIMTGAVALYSKCGYEVIPNYGPYADMPESVCMRRKLSGDYRGDFNKGIKYKRLTEKELTVFIDMRINQLREYFGCPSGKIGLLSSMFTNPDYRRRGIAKELLSRVVNDAKEYGCGTIQITASDMGVKLYTDFGFVHNGNFMQYKL